MKPLFLALALVCASPALAQEDRLSVSEFTALVDGKTLFFSRQGQPFGAEEYRRDRSVIWTFLDGNCLFGRWFPIEDDAICFVYEDRPTDPICWAFFRQDGDIRARVLGADPANDLTVTGMQRDPLQCRGPDVGV